MRSVDDTPFGGGPGMVMRPGRDRRGARGGDRCPASAPSTSRRAAGCFDQARVAEALAERRRSPLLCGRYEGVDERVLEARGVEEVSLGDFVLSGGEPAAIALIDACVRLLPGVMGAPDGLAEESFADGLLEYPHYTRPADWQGRAVPEVLLSGHHETDSRLAARPRPKRSPGERRPDLWSPLRRRQGQSRREEGTRAMTTMQRHSKRSEHQEARGRGDAAGLRAGRHGRVEREGGRRRARARAGLRRRLHRAASNAGLNSAFTVRKISYGEGVERVFPLYSPRIAESVEVVRRGDVRRAKLYYLRGRRGKSARIAERAREDIARRGAREHARAAASELNASTLSSCSQSKDEAHDDRPTS